MTTQKFSIEQFAERSMFFYKDNMIGQMDSQFRTEIKNNGYDRWLLRYLPLNKSPHEFSQKGFDESDPEFTSKIFNYIMNHPCD